MTHNFCLALTCLSEIFYCGGQGFLVLNSRGESKKFARYNEKKWCNALLWVRCGFFLYNADKIFMKKFSEFLAVFL